MSANPPQRSFLQELKRRKVVRTAYLYVAGAVATSGAAELFFPRLGLPDWTVTFVIALALVGLPLVLALAWAYDVTPDGTSTATLADGVPVDGVSDDGVPTDAPASKPSSVFTSGDRRSVAVLPFSDLSPDAQHAYFADGMTEDVLAHLGKVKALRVTSRTSVMRYRETTKPVGEIAAELGVGAVLEGSVRATADRVRVVAQLIDARTDTHLWADTYDRELKDIFAVQSEVAECVARALQAELSGDEVAEIHEPPTDDVAAYALFLEGMAAVRAFDSARYAQALALFEGALRIDPDYARAHAGLALLLSLFPLMTYSLPPHCYERLEAAVSRALELDPSSGHAWLARGFYLFSYERDWLGAEEAMQRAEALEPDDVNILFIWALYVYLLGRADEMDSYLDRLESLGEYTPVTEQYRGLAEMYRAAYGHLDFETPVKRLEALVAAEPMNAFCHVHRSVVLLWAGRLGEALEAVETGLHLAPDMPLAHGLRGAILDGMGRTQDALAEDRWFREAADPESADRFCWAMIHFRGGNVDRWLDLLEEGVGNRSLLLPMVRVTPAYRPLWAHPRFLALMDTIWPGEQKQVLGEYGWQPPVTADTARETDR